jgi:dolichol-phosphate mannosyltransferase
MNAFVGIPPARLVTPGQSLLLSVVVPVRNEAPNIRPLIAEIAAALRGIEHEIIYVDDGSTDATPQLLAAAAAAGDIRWRRHARSCGQSAALVTGARTARGEWLATLDGDGQNDPADIPRLLARATATDAGLILFAAPVLFAGHRVRRHDSLMKRIASRVGNGVRSRVLGDHTSDTGCGLKLLRRETFLELPSFDHMHRFLPALVLRAGGTVESVPVEHRPRRHGRSNYGTLVRLWVGLFDLVGVFWLQCRWTRPQIEIPEQPNP